MIKQFAWSLLVASLVGGILWISLEREITSKAGATIDVQRNETIDNLQLWLEKLEQCESGGKHVKVLDSNNKYSYYWLQFQESTFIGYAIELKAFPNAEPNELRNLLDDRFSQFKLAREMILDNYKNYAHWLLCSQKIGLPPKL